MRSRVAHFLGTSKYYAHSIPKTDDSSTMIRFAQIEKVAIKVVIKVAAKVAVKVDFKVAAKVLQRCSLQKNLAAI